MLIELQTGLRTDIVIRNNRPDPPVFTRIPFNCPIRGKMRSGDRVNNRTLPPLHPMTMVKPGGLFMLIPVIIEIRRDPVTVIMPNRIGQMFEPDFIKKIECAFQARTLVNIVLRPISRSIDRLQLLFGLSEEKDILLARLLADLDICPVPGPDRERAVQREFHIACARSFGSGRRNLFRQICRRNDDFRLLDIIIGNEGELQLAVQAFIVFQNILQAVSQSDDPLWPFRSREQPSQPKFWPPLADLWPDYP